MQFIDGRYSIHIVPTRRPYLSAPLAQRDGYNLVKSITAFSLVWVQRIILFTRLSWFSPVHYKRHPALMIAAA